MSSGTVFCRQSGTAKLFDWEIISWIRKKITSLKSGIWLFALYICQGPRPDFYIQLTLLNFPFAVRPKPFHTTLSGGVVNGVEHIHYLVCSTLYLPFDPILVKNQPQIFRWAESQDYRQLWFWLMEISDPLGSPWREEGWADLTWWLSSNQQDIRLPVTQMQHKRQHRTLL